MHRCRFSKRVNRGFLHKYNPLILMDSHYQQTVYLWNIASSSKHGNNRKSFSIAIL